jgi:hypothetical protein
MTPTKTTRTENPVSTNGYPFPNPWNSIRKDLTSKRRGAVIAVVAYIGADAPQVMPLRRGDSLVCDASTGAVKGRLTSANALLKYHHRGVAVYSLDDLHAKVICTPRFAWVGSTNASANSRDNRIEASVRVSGKEAQQVFAWAEKHTVEDRELSEEDIRILRKTQLDPPRRPHRTPASARPTTIPTRLKRIVFYEVVTAGAAEERIAKKSRSAARSAARAVGYPSPLGYIVWDGPVKARAGDWVFQVSNGHVVRPAYVVRVARSGSHRVIWLSYVKTKMRPSVAKLRLVENRLEPDFEECLIVGELRVTRVTRLYRSR